MGRKFQYKVIPSSWIVEEEHRLDCGPFVKGGIEARKKLEGLTCTKQPLASLTLGGIKGMYHVGQEKLLWVQDDIHGVPFLRSSCILKTDLSHQPYISQKQVTENPLFQCPAGTTLITRSGSIGQMTYMRKDMEHMAISQDVLKVVPDTEKIKAGYLYALLSSKYGIPIIIGGTFGSIIVHIEAENIAELPVPRLGAVEEQVHLLVQQAADLRAEGNNSISLTTKKLIIDLALSPLSSQKVTNFGVTVVKSTLLRKRLDARFHSHAALEAEQAIKEGKYGHKKLSDVVARLFKPPMFKRLWVDDPKFGRQFVSGIDAYKFKSENPRFVSKKTPNFEEFIIKKGWVIFQAAGQIYGLFGRPLYVNGWLENLFCADDMYRIVPKTEIDGGYIYLFFRTPHGEVLLKRQASGHSIPRVWDPQMTTVEIPWPSKEIRKKHANVVIEAHKKIYLALQLENKARTLVEQAIEQGAA